MPGWTNLRSLLTEEFRQCAEEGREAEQVEALRQELPDCGDDEQALLNLWQRLNEVPTSPAFGFEEPSRLETIRALRPDGPRKLEFALDDETLYDRMYGAWLGRCAGCALGKPVEGLMGATRDLTSKDRIRRYLQAIAPEEYPLRDYFPLHSPAEEETGRVGCPKSCRENIQFMETDDDIRYTVVGQVVFERHGPEFTSFDVARTWTQLLPYRFVCTAETQAYRNMVIGCDLHRPTGQEPDWDWVATHQNPYREWIGAQIRADSFGYAAPGNPELAAEFAWRDARMSHIKNGIYGEMFVAAMIAAAFACDDPLAILRAGQAEIPVTSRLHAAIQQTVEICQEHDSDPDRFGSVLDRVYEAFGHYHPVHTINNAALVVAAVLLGGSDFEKAITIAVMGGWDTDCNGATVGSVIGAMLGARRLPARWIEPLHDTLYSAVVDYHPIDISECARRSAKIARRVAGN